MIDLNDLFTKGLKLTFLIGAGSSIDPPSCLPAGRTMMDAMIKFACPESEFERISIIKELRFEGLVEILRDNIDEKLKIIDFYGLCDKPNLQHFFLAEMMRRGHFVMTTNFDFLIEFALLHSETLKEDLVCVITRGDFEKYNNPEELYEHGIKALYKIHGSTRNIISNESTKGTLVATIQAFGSNKEGMNVFQIEPFKKKLFNNISDGRILVVMGYSGSDDFDIVPTLKVLDNLKSIVWINYEHDDGGNEIIQEIGVDTIKNSVNKDKITKILIDIYLMGKIEHIYRVDVNTSRMVKELMDVKLEIGNKTFNIDPLDWLKQNVDNPDELEKLIIASSIYLDFGKYDDVLRIASKGLKIAEEKKTKEKIHFFQLFRISL